MRGQSDIMDSVSLVRTRVRRCTITHRDRDVILQFHLQHILTKELRERMPHDRKVHRVIENEMDN